MSAAAAANCPANYDSDSDTEFNEYQLHIKQLRQDETYKSANRIFSLNRAYSPKVEEMRDILVSFMYQPPDNSFGSHVAAFGAIQRMIVNHTKHNWEKESVRKARWQRQFLAEVLSLLLVLCLQVEKENRTNGKSNWVRHNIKTIDNNPTNNPLKHAVRKLKNLYASGYQTHLQHEEFDIHNAMDDMYDMVTVEESSREPLSPKEARFATERRVMQKMSKSEVTRERYVAAHPPKEREEKKSPQRKMTTKKKSSPKKRAATKIIITCKNKECQNQVTKKGDRCAVHGKCKHKRCKLPVIYGNVCWKHWGEGKRREKKTDDEEELQSQVESTD